MGGYNTHIKWGIFKILFGMTNKNKIFFGHSVSVYHNYNSPTEWLMIIKIVREF
jgi:hypothetical protein